MRLTCNDGEAREFTQLSEYLGLYGFDHHMLIRDEGMVQLGIPHGMTFSKALSLARIGISPPDTLLHWSRTHRRQNPANVSVEELVKSIDWIAIMPSILWRREDGISGKMGALTFFTRLVYKAWRLLSLQSQNQHLTLDTLLIVKSANEFMLSKGYEVIGYQYINDTTMQAIGLKDFDGTIFALHPSTMGWTYSIYVHPRTPSADFKGINKWGQKKFPAKTQKVAPT